MNDRPLALTDRQLHMIQWGAASLPATARAGYLEQATAQLSNAPTDADIRRAVESILDSAASIFRLGDVQPSPSWQFLGTRVMNDRPLALTDRQLHMIQWGAASLPVTARAGYLEQATAQLSNAPTDADIRRAVEFILDSAASIFRLGDVQ